MFLFLVLINHTGIPADDQVLNIGEQITTSNNKRKTMKETHMKYIDDLSFATAINLKENLTVNPDLPKPLSYHERNNFILPDEKNPMQPHFNQLQNYAREHQMVINQDKSKVMIFNQGWKYDFLPHILTEGGDMLEVVEECKLLGLVIRSDLSWQSNTEQLCIKAYNRLWMLRNLKKFGVNNDELIDVYNKQCRSVMELAVPAWAPGLTGKEVKQIERVQKSALAIILGDSYKSYKHALKKLDVESLESRREKLCLTFGKRALRSEKFSKWFSYIDENKPKINTRHAKSKPSYKLKPVTTKTKRYKRSPIPYITNLLNTEFELKNRKTAK